MMLIGSRALAFWNNHLTPEYKCREDSDWDIIGEQLDYELELKGERIEWHNPEILHNDLACKLYGSGEYLNGIEVCSVKGLALIKRSHLWRDYNFDKHITQYHKHIMPLFKYHGCVLKEYDLEFLQLRTKETKKEFPQRNPSLMQSNDDFFDDNVEKVYDHDYLHELYAFHDRPLFESLKQEDKLETAWCEKDKWEELSYEDKCKCCAEETYVISTERFIIPSEWDFAYRRAYFRSLQKVCTTLTSGWFRDFAIDNYPEIVALYDAQRFDHVKDMLVQEKVA